MLAPPNALSRFIGRDDAVVAVERLLGSTRLLTLTGAGGSGKTRLASHVAQRSANAYPDGVIWVELASVREAVHLPETVLAAIGVEQGSRAALDVLIDVLRDRRALLVLDNGGVGHETIALAAAPTRAVVWAGDQATSYLRAGCGAVVLLVMAEYDGPGALELVALRQLARNDGHRVRDVTELVPKDGAILPPPRLERE